MRTVPSRRGNKNESFRAVEKKRTVLSRRERYNIPRPVVKNYMHRPVPSSKNIEYIPSRPVMTSFICRPVPS